MNLLLPSDGKIVQGNIFDKENFGRIKVHLSLPSSPKPLKPAPFKTNSVQIGLTAASHVGAAVLAHVAHSSRSDLDAARLK